QALAVSGRSPIMRIANEAQTLAGLEFFEDERSEACELLRRRVESPRSCEGSLFQRGCKPVLRKNPDVVEETQPRPKRRRERHNHCQGARRVDAERLAADTNGLADRAGGLLVVERLERKHHIVGGERVAVREGDVRSEFQGVLQTIGRARPALREPGFDVPRRPVAPHQLPHREAADQVERALLRHEAVERAGAAPDGRNELAGAPARGRRRAGAGGGRNGGRHGRGAERPKQPRLSGQKLTHWPEIWPVTIVCRAPKSAYFLCKRRDIRLCLEQPANFLAAGAPKLSCNGSRHAKPAS